MGCRWLRSGWFETALKKDITRKIALDADIHTPPKNVRWNGVCFESERSKFHKICGNCRRYIGSWRRAGGALELGGFGIGGCRVVVCVSWCLIIRDGDTKAFPIKVCTYTSSYNLKVHTSLCCWAWRWRWCSQLRQGLCRDRRRWASKIQRIMITHCLKNTSCGLSTNCQGPYHFE